MHIRFLLILCITVLQALPIQAQQMLPLNEKSYIDSLNHSIKTQVSDSLKADAHYLLADYWRVRDTIKGRYYLQQAKKYSGNSPYLNAEYLFYEGQFYTTRNREKAAASYKKAQIALAKFNTKAALVLQASAWYNYAVMSKDKEGYPFVMKILTEQTIPLAQRSGNKERLAHYYSQFGTILMYNAKFEEAEDYNQKAIDLLEKDSPKSSTLLLAYIGAATNLIYANKKDVARKMLDGAKAILAPYPESVNYAFYELTECQYAISKANFEAALKSADHGIALARKNNQAQLLQMLYFRKYEAFMHQERYVEARKLLMDLLQEGTITKDANNSKTIYAELMKINELIGDKDAAYQWLKKYSTLSDSLSGVRLQETVSTLEAKYRNAESEKEIGTLQTEKAEQALAASTNKKYSWLLGGICCLLLIIALFSYSYSLNHKKLIRQKEINHQQEIQKREQEEQLKIAKAMLEGEETERERIAKDLHDGLGGMLAGVKINFSGWASKNLTEEKRNDFDKITQQLDRSVGELRSVARNLMPESLLKFGLETALKDLCEFYMDDRLTIDLQTYNIQPGIPLAVQLNLYRIVQELLSNSIKHGKSTNILLQCSQSEDTFFITVEDNGIGFRWEDIRDKKGMGMHNVRNRVEYLKGKLEINSQPGEGTTINIELHTHGND